MEKRRLGRTEMKVSRIGFGGMTIPNVSVDQAVATIIRALDLEVNFIDTARAYGKGDSESKNKVNCGTSGTGWAADTATGASPVCPAPGESTYRPFSNFWTTRNASDGNDHRRKRVTRNSMPQFKTAWTANNAKNAVRRISPYGNGCKKPTKGSLDST